MKPKLQVLGRVRRMLEKNQSGQREDNKRSPGKFEALIIMQNSYIRGYA